MTQRKYSVAEIDRMKIAIIVAMLISIALVLNAVYRLETSTGQFGVWIFILIQNIGNCIFGGMALAKEYANR